VVPAGVWAAPGRAGGAYVRDSLAPYKGGGVGFVLRARNDTQEAAGAPARFGAGDRSGRKRAKKAGDSLTGEKRRARTRPERFPRAGPGDGSGQSPVFS